MCMSPSLFGNCTIYSTWCTMICLVILILSLLLFIQSLYSLSKLQIFSIYLSLVLFLLLLVITLDIEHLNTYHYNILLGLVNIRSKGLTKQLYFPGAKSIQLHCCTACASTSTCTDTCTLTYLFGTDDTEPKGLTKKSSQGENLFLCNKFISSSIDFVAMTCIIMYCRTDMYIRTERVN